MTHEVLAIENFIRWNSPPIHKATCFSRDAFEPHLTKGN